jgi:hypothetical protein
MLVVVTVLLVATLLKLVLVLEVMLTPKVEAILTPFDCWQQVALFPPQQ